MTPTISVIIPAFNAERWIAEAVWSCICQDYQKLQVIIVNDGSTDHTGARARETMEQNQQIDIKLIDTMNRGASAARNIGLDLAVGDYVLFLDADDLLTPTTLHVLTRSIVASEPKAIFCWHSNIDDQGETICAHENYYSDGYANAVRSLYVQGGVLFPKTSLRFNETRVIWEGMEYIMDYLYFFPNSCIFTDHVSVRVRQHKSPDRISARWDHFEPGLTGRFFVEQKLKLGLKIDPERSSALDLKILGNAYSLMKMKRFHEADELLAQVSWSMIEGHDWYHVGSFAWAARWLGLKIGTRAFYYANKGLGRV